MLLFMVYATGRTFLDADSHLMELPDFLQRYADPSARSMVPWLSLSSGGHMADQFDQFLETRGHAPDVVDELRSLGDGLIAGPKNYEALGAFNADERVDALDLLGFHRQLVFATFSAEGVFSTDARVATASATAHNRGLADFCGRDPRLLAVGATSLDDPAQACRELEHIIELDMAAVWVPHRPAGGRSPGHNDLDPFWSRAAEAGIAVALHVGGDNLQLEPEWMNTGRPQPTDWLGGAENVRGKDMISLHHAAEKFVGTMVLDGVLERHPELRVVVVELGAGWVPDMIARLDHSVEIWSRSEPELAALERKPSEQIAAQMAFTPFVFEDVGSMIRATGPELYLFSSDYPHAEGGRNPLGRFGRSLESFDTDVLDKFYQGNFERTVPASAARRP